MNAYESFATGKQNRIRKGLEKKATQYIKAWKWVNGYNHQKWSTHNLAANMAVFAQDMIDKTKNKKAGGR